MTENAAQALWLRRFALFFIYAFVDDRLAVELADRAVAGFKAKTNDLNVDTPEVRRAMIVICRTFWDDNKKRIIGAKSTLELDNYGQPPTGTSFTPWIKFHQVATEEEILAIIFTQILRFPENETAEALKISVGTLRHRIGRGTRMLGEHVGTAI